MSDGPATDRVDRIVADKRGSWRDTREQPEPACRRLVLDEQWPMSRAIIATAPSRRPAVRLIAEIGGLASKGPAGER
jgi:hypothetical protein